MIKKRKMTKTRKKKKMFLIMERMKMRMSQWIRRMITPSQCEKKQRVHQVTMLMMWRKKRKCMTMTKRKSLHRVHRLMSHNEKRNENDEERKRRNRNRMLIAKLYGLQMILMKNHENQHHKNHQLQNQHHKRRSELKKRRFRLD